MPRRCQHRRPLSSLRQQHEVNRITLVKIYRQTGNRRTKKKKKNSRTCKPKWQLIMAKDKGIGGMWSPPAVRTAYVYLHVHIGVLRSTSVPYIIIIINNHHNNSDFEDRTRRDRQPAVRSSVVGRLRSGKGLRKKGKKRPYERSWARVCVKYGSSPFHS